MFRGMMKSQTPLKGQEVNGRLLQRPLQGCQNNSTKKLKNKKKEVKIKKMSFLLFYFFSS